MISLRNLLENPLDMLAEAACSLNRAVPRNIANSDQPVELHIAATGTIWNHF